MPEHEKEDAFEALSPDLQEPIEALDLSPRSTNSLKREGISTVGQLSQMPADELSDVRNLGENSPAEVADELRKRRLYLSEG